MKLFFNNKTLLFIGWGALCLIGGYLYVICSNSILRWMLIALIIGPLWSYNAAYDKKRVAASCQEGDLLVANGRFGDAIKCYDRALKGNSSCARAFYGRAIANKAIDCPNEAKADFKRALKLDVTLVEP